MLRLVTTPSDELRAHLASALFRGVTIAHIEAGSPDELLRAARDHAADLVVVDGAQGADGYAVCRAIRDDPALARTRAVLAVAGATATADGAAGVVMDRARLDAIAASGCDAVIALPIETDELYFHFAQLTGLSIRRDRRIGVAIELAIPGYGESIRGQVHNVSTGGLGVQLSTGLEPGMVVQLRLTHDGQVFPDAAARVAWVREESLGQLSGLTFDRTPPLHTLKLLEQLALYDLSAPAATSPMAGGLTVALQGDFTEISDFGPLAARLAREPRIDFNAAAVRYISSGGVRSWCAFLASLRDAEYAFRHLSLAFASQASMVPMVLGRGRVRSVEAPYLCEACDREELRLLSLACVVIDEDGAVPPVFTCATCNGPLELDDLPERYFAFLRW